MREASIHFGSPLSQPSKMITRKIWCSEYKVSQKESYDIFVIDNNFSNLNHVVALCPEKKKWVESSDPNWKKLTTELYKEISHQSQSQTSPWFDDRVVCSPIMVAH